MIKSKYKQLLASAIQRVPGIIETIIRIVIALGLSYVIYRIVKFLWEWMHDDPVWFITIMLHWGWIVSGLAITLLLWGIKSVLDPDQY